MTNKPEAIEPAEVKVIDDVGYYYLPIWKQNKEGEGNWNSACLFSKFGDADNYLKERASFTFHQKILKIKI
jgi:hypothetical protein